MTLDLHLHTDETTRTAAFEPSDIKGYLDLLAHSNSIDDRDFLLENIVTLMSRLSNSPSFSSLSKALQNTMIQVLYKDLPHPPSAYLSQLGSSVPTTGTTKPTTYAYRNADASNYVPLFPGLGQADAPYARSVPATNFTPPATLPDPGLVFDTLMRRDAFEPHPAGISSLFFAFADLIIHSVFNTSHTDPSRNLASSYLDLSVLYGSSQKEVDSVRSKDGRGRLYEDVFADSRLLFMPPSTGALLVVLNRNHNYTAQKILEINEHGTYKTVFKDEDEAKKMAQDDEIFNRARLVNCGYFMQIILGDYVGAILGLVRDGYSWRLDPLSQSREVTHDLNPRGEGNVVSIEFNLLYRWHAALSEQDTKWTEDLFNELFDFPAGKDFSTLTIQDFLKVAREKMRPDPDVRKWTFNKLQRGPDGRFKDSDLANILHNATSWRAGAFKGRGIPEVLRVIEVLGIEQARRWGACSMNDFRRFLGLKPYNNFQEWNPDPKIAGAAAKLYKDIENLELYVGLQAEEAKKPMAGAGLCPGFTISRSILSDAVCLTRGDPFLTVELTPWNLTAWGYSDIQFDPQDGSYGGMLTKLLFRTLPEYYPAGSAYAHFPFLDPVYMLGHMRASNPALADKYTWTRPAPPAADDVVVVKTAAGVRQVLGNQENFPSGYSERLKKVTGRGDVDQAIVSNLLLKETEKWAEYFMSETKLLIKKRSLDHVGKAGTVMYVDIVRDVINALPVHWICQQIAGLPLKDDLKDEQRQFDLFSDVCRYVYLNSEPSNDWRLRESSTETFKDFEKVLKEHLGSVFRILDSDRASLASSLPFLTTLHTEIHDLSDLSVALFTEVVPTAAHWSQAITHAVNFYLDEGHEQGRQEIIRLAKMHTPEARKRVAVLVRAALAADPPVWGVYRTAKKPATIVESASIPVGTRVFASIKEADAHATGVDGHNPILGIGEHGLLSSTFFEATVPGVLGEILGLKELKRGPGASGQLNRFVETAHGAPQQWYTNARSQLVPWPESLVVSYNSV
ncbi:heme peroxidase [Mycena belliarum]|uniref:Heme peroxidase n=1 Tax=Mycena belliarum TaxID=1033014 RepID=A0AAD6XS85_9AGAR|nr:heme peroxidase [Mycena belliae]